MYLISNLAAAVHFAPVLPTPHVLPFTTVYIFKHTFWAIVSTYNSFVGILLLRRCFAQLFSFVAYLTGYVVYYFFCLLGFTPAHSMGRVRYIYPCARLSL